MDIWFKAKVDWGEGAGPAVGHGGRAVSPRRYGNTPPRARPARSGARADALRAGAGRPQARGRTPRAHLRPAQRRPVGAAAVPARKAKQATAYPPKPTKAAKARQNPEKRRTEPRRKSQRRGAPEGGGAASTPVITLPLNDGSEWPVGRRSGRQWRELYPAVDVEQALRSMRGWLLPTGPRRKTARGIERFAAAWLARGAGPGRRGCWADLAGVLVGVLARAALAVPEGLAEAAAGVLVAVRVAAGSAARGERRRWRCRGCCGGSGGGFGGGAGYARGPKRFRSRCTGSGPTIRRSSGSYRRNSWNG